MTKENKNGIKWCIGILTGLITIIIFAFTLGVGFAQNESDHQVISIEQKSQGDALKAEIGRATMADENTKDAVHRMERVQDVILEKVDNIEAKL